jgi:hypothetical protein
MSSKKMTSADTVGEKVMRAKMVVQTVNPYPSESDKQNEQITFSGVSASSYPADGSDENNTFARFSPSVALQISITNPALHGQIKPGDTFYVDFTRAPK